MEPEAENGADAGADRDRSESGDGPLVVRARIAGRPGHRDVRGVRVLIRDGGRMDYSPQGRIAFDKRSPDGFYDVYIADDEGTELRCVTCDSYALHKQHALSPVWHPSGEYLVIQVQTAARKLKMSEIDLATPHRGLHSELWAITADGRQYWQLTTAQERGSAVLDPVFSHEADRLAWSERLTTRGGRRFGDWGTRVAAFSLRRGTPRLGKTVTVLASDRGGLEVVQGFTPDDRGLLLAASPLGQLDDGIDVVRVEIESGAVTDLTASPENREPVARFAPDSRRIAFASGRAIEPLSERHRRLPWRNDLWIMAEDGSAQERLTFFNDEASDHYLEQAMISDLAWSPDGDRLLVHVVHAGALTVEQAIWAVTLDPTYRR